MDTFERILNMRRINRLLLVVFLVSTVITLFSTEVKAQSKPKGDITIWMWKSDWDPVTKSAILDDFAKEYPDIKVNRVDISAPDVYQKLPLAISAGTGAPDVSLVEDSPLGLFVGLA